MDFLEMFTTWLKTHVGVLFMGVAGATVSALTPSPHKTPKDKIYGWVVGVIMSASLSSPTANALTSGQWVEVFGFIYGMGGITLSRMFIRVIDKKARNEIEAKTGVKLDDDNH